MSLKEGETDSVRKINIIEPMLDLYGIIINEIYLPQDIEYLAILYSVNQPIDLQLQNGSFYLISIFDINEYLESDIKNIACSLYRIALFII